MKGSLAVLCLLVAFADKTESESSSEDDTSNELTGQELLSSINEAKKMVDEAYKVSRERSKADADKTHVTPADFLKHLKEPVAATRTALRAASYLDTSLDLLKKKLQKKWMRPFNLTDVLTSKQKETISKATGCDYVTRPISCPLNSPYRTITGECNNRKHPHYGASNRGYARWLPAEYEDGISLPRGLIQGQLYNGHTLPLVRSGGPHGSF
nr:PREDICTED: myeloperoxidase isoform X2 [Anolis carolinensis]|eukprot:XP_016854566.1 PREDICTED: myeloperoxidase isoform X2 [Anolis carolinensis]